MKSKSNLSAFPQRSSKLQHVNKSKYFEEIFSLTINHSSNTDSDILILNKSFLAQVTAISCLIYSRLFVRIMPTRFYQLVSFPIAVKKYSNKSNLRGNIYSDPHLKSIIPHGREIKTAEV